MQKKKESLFLPSCLFNALLSRKQSNKTKCFLQMLMVSCSYKNCYKNWLNCGKPKVKANHFIAFMLMWNVCGGTKTTKKKIFCWICKFSGRKRNVTAEGWQPLIWSEQTGASCWGQLFYSVLQLLTAALNHIRWRLIRQLFSEKQCRGNRFSSEAHILEIFKFLSFFKAVLQFLDTSL